MHASLELNPPSNEPVLTYAPGSTERAALIRELERQASTPVEAPLVIGGQAVLCEPMRDIRAPHRHSVRLGAHAVAGAQHVDRAIQSAMDARAGWNQLSFDQRAAVFLRAAELLSGPWRQRLNAATMLNQSKTAPQAEIDSACELIDFLRFNVYFGTKLQAEQPLSTTGVRNRIFYRPLDGFVYAVTPFNFTAIAGNLPTAPALMGNTVVWKPSPHAVLSAHHIMQLLMEAGLPDGVINLVHGDAEAISESVLSNPAFAGLHFTGSTTVLQGLWRRIGENLPRYRCYPRIVGESGGKDFIFAHPSADPLALGTAIIRGGYEYQGQKCSAPSRLYLPRSLWKSLEKSLCEEVAQIKVGDPADFSNFMGAVIGKDAFRKITGYLDLAARDPSCRMVFGGDSSDEEGYFIRPALIEVQDPKHRLMSEEIFGPVVAAWIYQDDRYQQALEVCEQTSPYGLTGAIFARDAQAVELAQQTLRSAVGNFYVNDKPTGAVVGQQPFGGSRLSGTNDKAGAIFNLLRWVSPQTIKENFNPPRDWRYASQG
ncbi:MAG TPA: L-glutamate gamma-semialdehyde dehydrogenase [Polyangiaceae bacterium]|jgi:1-pyrroline-5-carboxylate dehydrogenase